jgi:plasmid stabilization system protein ParE
MAYTIKVTNEAKSDFRNMFNYYLSETQDAEYTKKIIQEIRGKIEHLKSFPYRHPATMPDDESIRTMYYKRYAIQYEVQESTVVILNIKHTSALS